jgi:hypothetical protein
MIHQSNSMVMKNPNRNLNVSTLLFSLFLVSAVNAQQPDLNKGALYGLFKDPVIRVEYMPIGSPSSGLADIPFSGSAVSGNIRVSTRSSFMRSTEVVLLR